jgi:Heparinase II/III-like protein/Heparinase II/III N-terminus
MSSGTAAWKRVYRRVLAMDRAEIADRIRQHAAARLDLVRYKAGAHFVPRMHAAVSGLQPRFFFAPDAVSGLCSKLRHVFPETAEQIIERAARICGHRFDLLGYDAVDYGSEIDWHCDGVHGKRAPRKPWFLMKYLDFAEVGDSKVTWELNRHQHLVTLAKAFRLSGNQKFAAELFRQWEHWHAENPYPIGINWASSLEVAFRSLSWLWVYFLLADSPAMTAGFRAAWIRSLAVSGRHIDCYLSTYFSPNTHLLGEAVALFFIGTLCPEIPAARRWQQRGWKIVQQEGERQVHGDGLHFEQSLYYHVYALDFFLHAAVLASVNHIPTPAQFDRTLERMLEALSVLARGGIMPQLGDDDGGRLFDPARNRRTHLLDPLAAGAVLFGRGDFKMLAGSPREETLWLLGEAGLEEFDRLPPVTPTRNSVAFRVSGLYVMTGDHPERQLVIDAGPQGAHTAGHGHADALSLTARSGGYDLLIDSGTLEYVGADGERNRFRGTKAHNTLSVANHDQAEPKGPFSWGRLPNVEAEDWIVGQTFDLFAGSHDGYSRLPNPVVHRRFVFSLKSGFWLVRDQALGFGDYQLDLRWHLAPGLNPVGGGENVFLAEGHGLRFVTVEGDGWTESVEEQPNSPVYGKTENHNVLHFATKAQLPTEFVTLLVLASDALHSEHKLTRIAKSSSPVSSAAGYCYKTAHSEHHLIFGQGTPWTLDQWSSDATFLYWGHAADSSMQTLICCNATYVRWSDQAIVTAKRAVLRCETIERGTQFEVVSSDPESVVVDREGWRQLRANGTPQLAGKLAAEEKN